MRRLLVGVLLVTTACGGGGAKAPVRTVDVTMKNVAFDPATLSVTKGETVTFRFTNADAVLHDAFVGTAAEQAEHEKQVTSGGGHGHGDDANAVEVPPGKTVSLTHTFDGAGTVEVGCHEPGHYGAGMKIVVTVAP